jgi:hypothetical protein
LVTEESEKIRFLVSPPLVKKVKKNQLILFSGATPIVKSVNQNEIQWNYKGTKFKFLLQKIQGNELYGNLNFSVRKIAKQSITILR